MARHDLRRLTERNLLYRLGRSVGGRRAGSEGFGFSLGTAGQRLVGPPSKRPREPWTPSSNHLRHALAVTELYVQLRELEDEARVEVERFDAEPRCWRFFGGPGGSRLVLKPDAFVMTAVGDYVDSWFIELDRATEPTTRHRGEAEGLLPLLAIRAASRSRRACSPRCCSSSPPTNARRS